MPSNGSVLGTTVFLAVAILMTSMPVSADHATDESDYQIPVGDDTYYVQMVQCDQGSTLEQMPFVWKETNGEAGLQTTPHTDTQGNYVAADEAQDVDGNVSCFNFNPGALVDRVPSILCGQENRVHGATGGRLRGVTSRASSCMI